MKSIEREFWQAIKNRSEDICVRDVCHIFRDDRGVPVKRMRFWLNEWSDKGWYDYGVTLDLGWLTEEGEAALA